MKVPTSTARRGAITRLSSDMNVPCSGPICRMTSPGNRRAVSARRSASRASGGLVWAMT